MICPFCGYDNMAGVDRCEECLHPFRDLDVPQPTAGLQKHLMEDACDCLRLIHPVNVSVDDSVAHTIELMKEHGVGCALVLEGEKLVGIFTERDILMTLVGADKDLERLMVREVMISDPVKLREDDTMASALNKMSVGGFRHLPVVREGNIPIGVVSIKDILGYICTRLRREIRNTKS
jgi:CBS domain-containing protein